MPDYIPTQLLVCEVVATTRSWLPTLSRPKEGRKYFPGKVPW